MTKSSLHSTKWRTPQLMAAPALGQAADLAAVQQPQPLLLWWKRQRPQQVRFVAAAGARGCHATPMPLCRQPKRTTPTCGSHGTQMQAETLGGNKKKAGSGIKTNGGSSVNGK